MEQQHQPSPQDPETAAAQFAANTAGPGRPETVQPPGETAAALDELGQRRQEQAAAAQADRASQMQAALNPAALDAEHGHIGPSPEASQDQQPPAGPAQSAEQQRPAA